MRNLDEIRRKLQVPLDRIKHLLGEGFAVTLIGTYTGKDKNETDLLISTDGVTVAAETLLKMAPKEPETVPTFDNAPEDLDKLRRYFDGYRKGAAGHRLTRDQAQDPLAQEGYDAGYASTTNSYKAACIKFNAKLT